MIEKWLGVCGLNLEEYLMHLGSDCSSDGLELWLTSISMDTLFNVVMDDCVYSTSHDRIDFSHPIFLLASYSEFIPCEEVPDDENPVEGAAAAVPDQPALPPPLCKSGGQPLTKASEYPQYRDSSDSDTDPDTLLDAQPSAHPPIQNAGVSIPRTYPVCKLDVESGMALYCHLHSQHPEVHLYPCDHCGGVFNNIKERSSHCSNMHHPKMVSCKECDYVATSRVKMQQHI